MYSTLIVPLDGSPFATQAIAPAMFLSAQMHATLRLVHVHESAPNPTYRAPAWDEFFRAQDEAYLESLAERIQSGVTTPVDCSVLDGDVVMAICASIEASASPLVIMSTHGRTGIRRAWLGGVTTGVLRHSPAPVLVVRPHGEDPAIGCVPTDAPFADVIVALDGSAFAEQILPHAVRLARVSNAHLVLLRVVDAGVSDSEAEDASAYLKGVADRFADGCPPPDARVETHRSPAAAILALAAASPRPLVAMASHGRGLSRLFLGSVADEVMRRTSGAVLVIRPRV
jgi:nucleotide-binding universal stress UspA family protein